MLSVDSKQLVVCLCYMIAPVSPRQAVKIQGQNKEMLATACQMFMGKSEAEVAQIALETLEGHQRAIIAHLTVEEIYQDRKKFSEQVFKVASSDLVNMGIGVVSYTLKDVHDDQDYLHSLGKARTAQVQKDARIGEAQYKRDAEAHAMQEKVSAQYKNEIEMAKAQRDYELKKAAYDIEVNSKKAESEMAYQLQLIMEAEAEAESIKVTTFYYALWGVKISLLLFASAQSRAPMSKAQKITMVSSGGSEVGAAKLAGEVLDIMTRLPEAVEKLTGVEISQVSGKASRVR
ncbi:hypothetical protein XENOCAPTIV_013694 [Xenoophorus captivus]|uniref:Flotillin n=1 Tax=Xenoophorus captivus TaxID=1517983 RepID=A0ABV0QKG3_9TELE